MEIRNKMLTIKVNVEEFDKINSHAKDFHLATGTYLRLLGLAGGLPFKAKAGGSSLGFRNFELHREDIEHIAPKKKEGIVRHLHPKKVE